MPLTIPVAHDFTCPWCWVGFLQARRLRREFDVQIEWRGYELWPENLPRPPAAPPIPPPLNRPPTMSRLDFLLHVDGMELPAVDRPSRINTHGAHEAVEFAKSEGCADELVEAIYRAFWEDGRDISQTDVLLGIAEGIVGDLDGLRAAIDERRFADRIVPFDAEAYKTGVFNVPTFFIGEKRFAEQPYDVLRRAVSETLGYPVAFHRLEFPNAPVDRPYVYIDMVTTIDGKTVTSDPGKDIVALGSTVDRDLMRRLEASADAVMVGGQTLRVTSPNWNPKTPIRVAVSSSGDLPFDAGFFTGGRGIVATNRPIDRESIVTEGDHVDLRTVLQRLRQDFGVERLLVFGGSELNAQLLRDDLVDELFLTVAPKVKLGKGLPTYAGGEPLPGDAMQRYSLVEHHVVGSEVFLRYRREHD